MCPVPPVYWLGRRLKTGFSLVLEPGRELGLEASMTLTGATAAMPGARFLDFFFGKASAGG